MSGALGLRVMVLEDEPIVAMTVDDYLRCLGCTVIGPASTISCALDLIDSEVIDAAILDININGERSDPVAERLDGRGTPYLFATGYGLQGIRAPAGQVVLQKPYRLRQLEAGLLTITRPAPPITMPGPRVSA